MGERAALRALLGNTIGLPAKDEGLELLLPERLTAAEAASALEAVPDQWALLLTAWPNQMMSWWLNQYFPQGLFRLRRDMPNRDALLAVVEKLGWQLEQEAPWWVPDACDAPLLYAGKHRPGLYFDRNWRVGFAAFHNYIQKAELEGGISGLWADLRAGRFMDVARKRPDTDGDYTLLLLRRAGGEPAR